MLGRHTIKTWSKTQTLLALSSGESEFYAALKASAEGLGMMSLMKDFNYAVTGEVWVMHQQRWASSIAKASAAHVTLTQAYCGYNRLPQRRD